MLRQVRKTLAIAGAATATLLLPAACSNATGNTENREQRFTVGVTTLFPTGTFAEFVGALKAQGAQHNMTFDVQDVGNDAGKEYQVLSAFATRKVDLVVASAVSPTGSIAALQRLKSAGIPVLCYNTCLNPPQDQELSHAFVTNDQKILGETTGTAAAEYIKTKLGGSAKVAFLTCETYDVCKQRRQGLDQALAAVSTDVVASQEGFVVDKATPIASAILSAHPDVSVIIAENEDGVIAADNAIKARGLTGKTVVFGIGMNPVIAQLMLSGDRTVQHTTGQDAAAWASEVIKTADALRNGQGAGEYNHFTPGPVFSASDPDPIRQYLTAHPS